MTDSMADSALRPPVSGDAHHTDTTDCILGLLDALMTGETLDDAVLGGLLSIYGDIEAQRALTYGLFNCGLINSYQLHGTMERLGMPESVDHA